MKCPMSVSARWIGSGVFALVLTLWTGCAQAQPPVERRDDAAELKKGSVNGKYVKLLRKLEMPESKDQYTEFYDWGYWTGTTYGKYDNLPPGYWVYAHPNWYIWGALAPAKNEPAVEKDAPAAATVNGKYSKLLRKLNMPDKKGVYGEFYEWGHWTGTAYGDHVDLPPGYWVYVYPNWYIWGEAK